MKNQGYERHVYGQFDMWCRHCELLTAKWRCPRCDKLTVHITLMKK